MSNKNHDEYYQVVRKGSTGTRHNRRRQGALGLVAAFLLGFGAHAAMDHLQSYDPNLTSNGQMKKSIESVEAYWFRDDRGDIQTKYLLNGEKKDYMNPYSTPVIYREYEKGIIQVLDTDGNIIEVYNRSNKEDREMVDFVYRNYLVDLNEVFSGVDHKILEDKKGYKHVVLNQNSLDGLEERLKTCDENERRIILNELGDMNVYFTDKGFILCDEASGTLLKAVDPEKDASTTDLVGFLQLLGEEEAREDGYKSIVAGLTGDTFLENQNGPEVE